MTTRWTSTCAGCNRDNVELESREDHAMRALCDRCAQQPPQRPTAGPDQNGPDQNGAGPQEPPASGTPDGAPPSGTFPLLTFDDLLTQPDPSWLIEELVPAGCLSVVFGAPESFKSFIALDWALCVATGQPWFGHEVKPGWVVYVAAEGSTGLKRRVVAWWEAHGRPDMSRARFLTEAVNLLDHAQVERAKRTLDLLPERARLLTVDTMARSMVGGDENSARDVGIFIAAVDALRRADAALVIHHAGKDGKDERGSSALRGAADLMVKTEREGDSPKVTLLCDKTKDFERWDALTLQREVTGRSCVLSLVDDSDVRDELRDRVLAHITEHGPVSQNAIEKAVTGRARDKREAIKSLERDSQITREANGWQVRPDSPDAPGRTPDPAPGPAVRPAAANTPKGWAAGTHPEPRPDEPRPDELDEPSAQDLAALFDDGSVQPTNAIFDNDQENP